jgi:hypothetical protein
MACVMSSAYERFPHAFLIFLGSDLGVRGRGDSDSCRSVFITTRSGESATTACSGSGQVLERDRGSFGCSNSNGAYSMAALFLLCSTLENRLSDKRWLFHETVSFISSGLGCSWLVF